MVMNHRVLGVGVGVFIIAAIWIGAICLAYIFSKTKRPISFLGCGVVVLAFLITVILLCVPKETEDIAYEPELLPPDYLFIWRLALLVFLIVSFFAAVVVMVTEHWAVPHYAKPLKKVSCRTIINKYF